MTTTTGQRSPQTEIAKEIEITPKVSVIMPCYNRDKYVGEAVESILNQTYEDFEFIIIDDNSTDGTPDIIESYARKDKRIRIIINKENKGLIFNLRAGLEIARGEYIARMDDDDISLPIRFKRQVDYMDQNPDIAVVGTFIELFGTSPGISWINESDPHAISVLVHFFNPMCHPSTMLRKSFLDMHGLNYSHKALYAEDYALWKEIIRKGGLLANIPEKLLKYRVHPKSITKIIKSNKIQSKTAKKIRGELLSTIIKSRLKRAEINKKIFSYPFEYNNAQYLMKALEAMKDQSIHITSEAIDRLIQKHCGHACVIDIFLAADDKFSQHLCVTLTSILKNSLSHEEFRFYVMDGGISLQNKRKIEEITKIKNFSIEYIKLDDHIFENLPITEDCKHISLHTYYRYLIPELKPNLEKTIYLDCDLVIKNSLFKLWDTDISDAYAAAVEELHEGAPDDGIRLGVKNILNAGVILINCKKWREDDIPRKLFENTSLLVSQGIMKWQDQDVLNFTFKDKVVFVSPRYNLQQNAFHNGQHSLYSDQDMRDARRNPTIIHYNSFRKPWSGKCQHPLWPEYFAYLKLTPYKKEYYSTMTKLLAKKLFKVIYKKTKSTNKTKHYFLGVVVFKKVKNDQQVFRYILGVRTRF